MLISVARAVVIQSSGGLGKGDIERMVREAEQYASQDKKRRVRTCNVGICYRLALVRADTQAANLLPYTSTSTYTNSYSTAV